MEHVNYLDWVATGWGVDVQGYAMYQLYTRLKFVKAILKEKNTTVFWGISLRVERARHDLASARTGFMESRGSCEWLIKEKECMHHYLSLVKVEENFLRQKSRVQWVTLGDGNSAFFHKVVKARNASHLVKILKDDEGNIFSDPWIIMDMAIEFYRKPLGSSSHDFTLAKAERVTQLLQK
jgi:hypothetical protein